ncbi:MAG: lytic transglycosylase domain-containing protein, partial [Victivallaceae bacterium]
MVKKKKHPSIFRRLLYLTAICLLVAMGGLIMFTDPVRDWWVDDSLYWSTIQKVSRKYNVDPQLVRAVIFRESRFNPMARGDAGEVGLMQIMPNMAVVDWARAHKRGVPSTLELYRPDLNIEIGVWFLAKALRRFDGYQRQVELALCQYNAGPTRAGNWKPLDKNGEIMERITIDSTRRYVEVICQRYQHYKARELADRKQITN